MLGFIVRRLVSAILVVVLTSMFVFTMFYKGASNPALALCQNSHRCTPDKEALLEHDMGLDLPLVTAYSRFVGGLFHSRTMFYGTDIECPAPCLGISYANRQPVTHQLIQKYPATLVLALGGALIELVLGVGIGVIVARYRGSAIDRALVGGTLVVQAIPYYIIAILLWVFLTLKWPLFPQDASGFSVTGNPLGTFHMFALPWMLIGVAGAANYIRYTRGQMIETVSEDYIRTASAKGLSQNRVLFKHALRAAIVPVITIFGLDLAVLLTGTIYTEHIFGIDGFGNWSISAMRALDFPVLTANTLVTAVVMVVANLIVDVVYGFLDPRVRIS
jgi:peptide/nickel transport system permease protein